MEELTVKELKNVLLDYATAIHADRMHGGKFKDCERWGCSAAIQALNSKVNGVQ